MVEIINQYSGEGKFHFVASKEFKLDLGFTITQFSDAKIELFCYFIHWAPESLPGIADLVNLNNTEEIKVSMEGKIHDPMGNIKVEEAFISKMNFHFDLTGFLFNLVLRVFKPVEIVFKEIESGSIRACAGLTNFIFRGCKTDDEDFHGLMVNLEDFPVYFRHVENYNEYAKSLNDLEETILVTSEASIDFSYESVNITDVMNNLSDLLSYACRTRISHIYEDYYFENIRFKTVLRPVITKEFNNKNNLIDSDHLENCSLKSYLETCYSNYLEFKNKFALNLVISFYLESVTHNYMDISFLLAATTLETILNGYEELCEEEGNPIIKGILKRNKKEILKILNEYEIEDLEEITEKIVDKISYKHPTLNDKLSTLTKDRRFLVELEEFDRDFIPIRNKIAHTGKFPETVNSSGKERAISLHEELNRLIYLLDRIILIILNYKEKPFINRMDNSIIVLE
ncbi:hypothetical protein [Methanobacterium oryzae]|uniref:hypothetical protein n=1 Tax=Methanobacterium oryzae TaxID=69540 RepID=UPI003D1DFFC2